MNSMSTVAVHVNTTFTSDFRQVVTAGWANKSDGNVEAPVGHFALVTIEANELAELTDAVFDGEENTIRAGNFMVCEDNYGNTQVVEYHTKRDAEQAFDMLAAEYSQWDGQGSDL